MSLNKFSGSSSMFAKPCRCSIGKRFYEWNLLEIGENEIMDFLRIILSVLVPPLGVFLQVGLGGAFWLNILLTILGYIPGVVHAVYIIAKR